MKLAMTVELDERGEVDTLVFGGAPEETAARLWHDFQDGAALRRLREALPGHMVEAYGPRRDGMFLVQAHSWDAWDEPNLGTSIRVTREARTIAEAADKCREAMG